MARSKGGPFRIFKHPFHCKIYTFFKIEGGLFGENFFLENLKKSHNAEKTERGPFSLAKYCYAEKKEQPF